MAKETLSPHDYVERVRDDTQRYASELLAENERLRLAMLAVQQENARLKDEALSAREELQRAVARETELRQAFGRVEEENRSFATRFTQVELENSNLANLYVASYQLHGTVERAEVIAILQEITANLVGSEQMLVFELEPDGRNLHLVAGFGIDTAPYQRVPLSRGLIGHVARTGELFVTGANLPAGVDAEPDLTACIPLRLSGRVTGVIAIFRLLPQKSGLEPLDRELFELLATHAATALYCSGLAARASSGPLS